MLNYISTSLAVQAASLFFLLWLLYFKVIDSRAVVFKLNNIQMLT